MVAAVILDLDGLIVDTESIYKYAWEEAVSEVGRGFPYEEYDSIPGCSSVSPADCVAFEDSEAGIQAVAAAGMTGILVLHWPASAEALRAAEWSVTNLHEGRHVLESMIERGE